MLASSLSNLYRLAATVTVTHYSSSNQMSMLSGAVAVPIPLSCPLTVMLAQVGIQAVYQSHLQVQL
ncbi:MAG: hypothetical protein ACFBSC_11150 [Microcoleaceae cyanobacterium]